ncbi:hypothetical protein ACKXF8_07955 [Faecalibacterium prausnitzii]|uniref:hypothetical protein n=1 Tax=Faecalibacterium prausnitzii TaxID=853 RepID=UPI003C2CCC1F
MKRKQQMSKNTRQTEKVASGSPYINRCGEYTIEVEFAGSSSLESCIAAYLNEKYQIMKNIKLNKDECFDNPLKMNAG